jgi:hypothetical protein
LAMVRFSAVVELDLRGVDGRCFVWRCGEVERIFWCRRGRKEELGAWIWKTCLLWS